MKQDLLPPLLDVDDRRPGEPRSVRKRLLRQTAGAELGDSLPDSGIELPILFKARTTHILEHDLDDAERSDCATTRLAGQISMTFI